jgi:co-chaperonin GroES (HSP10)
MKMGDVIAYRKFGESSFYIGGEMVKFISFDDVLAVIKEKK